MIVRSAYTNVRLRTAIPVTTGAAVRLNSSTNIGADAIQVHNCSLTSDLWIATDTATRTPSVNDKDIIVGPGQTLIYECGPSVVVSGIMATADATIVVTEVGY